MNRAAAWGCAVVLGVGLVGCRGSSQEDRAGAPPAAGSVAEDDGSSIATSTVWTEVATLPGALRGVVSRAGGFAAILDDADEDWSSQGALWWSVDGVEWSPVPGAPDAPVFELASDGEVLFALTGDPLDDDPANALWHVADTGSWQQLLADEHLDHVAISDDRLIAYRQGRFQLLGVFDTDTLAPVELEQRFPAVEVEPTDQVAALEEGLGTLVYQGRAVGLDDGFLAEVGWLVGLEPTVIDWRMLRSSDGATWTEHDSADGLAGPVPGRGAAPRFEGLNLLWDEGGAGRTWVTDTGTDVLASWPAHTGQTYGGTSAGFFRIREPTPSTPAGLDHSLDGVDWDELPVPPSWSQPALVDVRDGFVAGSVVTTDGALVAVGVHGEPEGWGRLADATTVVWTAALEDLVASG